jgi:phenylacetate-coenzyme A ligase PaaK-like adenylate-forming protein
MANLADVEGLCALRHPYRINDSNDALFNAAMHQIVDFHCRHTPGYALWLKANGFSADKIETVGDWARLPPIFANYFKRRQLLSSTAGDSLELTSSGTSGQKSRMCYDPRSLAAAQGMVDRIFGFYGWDTPHTRCNYLLLSHEPVGSITLGTTHTDQFLCKYAQADQVVYALRATGSGHVFDAFGVIRALELFAGQGLPVRLIGFPSFLWFVLERMREIGHPGLELAPDSLVFVAGGWKTHAAGEVPKAMLYRRLGEQLGVPDVRCRDGYGAVEHPVPYIECVEHHLHVPVYARAFVRDCATLAPLGYGARGMLHLVSPYITSSPAHSVVMSDLAVLQPGRACGCGLGTDWFEVLGRASVHRGRGCALAASELLQGG